MFLIGYTNRKNTGIHNIFTCAREKEAGRKKRGKEEEEGEDWGREEERGGKKDSWQTNEDNLTGKRGLGREKLSSNPQRQTLLVLTKVKIKPLL
mgnify:CR=1 FL=1